MNIVLTRQKIINKNKIIRKKKVNKLINKHITNKITI